MDLGDASLGQLEDFCDLGELQVFIIVEGDNQPLAFGQAMGARFTVANIPGHPREREELVRVAETLADEVLSGFAAGRHRA